MAHQIFNYAERIVGQDDVGSLMETQEICPEGCNGRLSFPWVKGLAHCTVLLKEQDASEYETGAHDRPNRVAKLSVACGIGGNRLSWRDGYGLGGFLRYGRTGLDFGQALAEDWLVPAARNLEDEGLVSAFGGEVQFDALSQFGSIYANDIVLASVIGGVSSEDLGADLLLMDLRAALFEGLASDVEEEVTKPGGSSDLRTGGYAIDESASLVNARLV